MLNNYNYHNNKIESSNFSLLKTFTNFKMSKRTSVTVSYDNFKASQLVVAEEPYALEKGGKIVSLRYQDSGRTYDILRLQTPELTIGNVWDNMDQQTQQLASHTIALNLDTLHAADAEAGVEEPPEDADEAAFRKYDQFTFVQTLDAIDNAVVDKAVAKSWFKEKGKALDRAGVSGKFSNTCHWPNEEKYTLGIRVKINVRDYDYSTRKVFIFDQEERDISYYKLDEATNERVYSYDTARFNGLSTPAVFNIDALRTRNTRILRAIIESNNAWVQTGLSVSWKLTNVQVEVNEGTTYGNDAWVPSTTNKRRRVQQQEHEDSTTNMTDTNDV